jgi:hypothetical protein
MKLLPLVTSASLVLFLAQSAPAKQASRVTAAPSITSAQTKFCQEWAAMQRSVNQDVDRRAALMTEVRKSPRKSTMGEALPEFHPGDGKANQIVFISTFLEKGESGAISKMYGTPSYDCPNIYTLIKSVSDAKGFAFMQEFQVLHLP